MRQIPDTWITVVGIGDDGMDGLSPEAWAIVEKSQVIAGGPRHLSFLHPDERTRLSWGSPMHAGLSQLDNHQTEKVCVLASGDPNWFGIAKHLIKKFGIENVTVLPVASSFSHAAARLGWGLQDVVTTSVHGRDLSALSVHFTPENRILTLTNDGTSPAAIAALLREKGFAASEVAVFAHLGGPSEGFFISTAAEFPDGRMPDLNVVAIEVYPDPETQALSTVPGLPDRAFESDGRMTKREVRAMTLANLSPFPGQVLWDIGAGSGSIGIEWMRVHPSLMACAIEKDADKLARIGRNAQSLGVPKLKLLEATVGTALPDVVADLPDPDAIFVGGGLSNLTHPNADKERDGIDALWHRLRPGGRMVANVVTAEGEVILQNLRSRFGGDMSRISVSRAEPVGTMTGWKPFMSVTQWSMTKS